VYRYIVLFLYYITLIKSSLHRFRVRLTGPNGIGKTTLLERIVNGDSPGVKIRPGATVGYYRQDFYNLDHDSTILACLMEASSGKHNEQHIRMTAASFLLRGQTVSCGCGCGCGCGYGD
jgi:ATPase subunit of ABC transporter with duplicated ATPase domains